MRFACSIYANRKKFEEIDLSQTAAHHGRQE
jgi:hypothetical protein